MKKYVNRHLCTQAQHLLTPIALSVNGISFSDCLMASGWVETSKTTKGMNMTFLPHFGTYEAAQKQYFDKSGLVCKVHTKIQKNLNAISRHANFTRIVHFDFRNKS